MMKWKYRIDDKLFMIHILAPIRYVQWAMSSMGCSPHSHPHRRSMTSYASRIAGGGRIGNLGQFVLPLLFGVFSPVRSAGFGYPVWNNPGTRNDRPMVRSRRSFRCGFMQGTGDG
jgi:hypothetical protein